MKQTFTIIILLAAFSALAQNGFKINEPSRLNYDINGMYRRPVKQQALQNVKSLSDAIEGYPVNWVTTYLMVDVSAVCNGKKMKATSIGETLTKEQREILKKADMATDVVIFVKYKYNNPGTGIVEDNKVNVMMTVVPDIEAEFAGGKQMMKNYLKENVISKIPDSKVKQLRPVSMRFTINEEGEITNPKLNNSCGDTETDKLILETISKMPKWKPAQMLDGKKVKQEFKFSMGNNVGC
ncbi:MAG: hypothetical protein K0S32_2086 [Bacteroidetes bacterium]|jgi:TonB family protein|nr:hypothetical protein [Bacteroidota bacterium]